MSRHRIEQPPRPTIPLALWCLVGAIVCERAVLAASLSQSSAGLELLALVAALCCGTLLLAIRLARLSGAARDVLVVGTLSALAVLLAVLCGMRQHNACEQLSSRAVSGWELRVTDDCRPSDFGYTCLARVQSEDVTAAVRLSLAEPVPIFTRLRCVGRYRLPSDDEFGRTSWCQGICGSVSVVRLTKTSPATGLAGALARLRAAALQALEPQKNVVRALMAGCVCGYRVALDERGMVDAFSRCGIAHLIAVSGAHLAVVCSLLSRMLGSVQAPRYLRLTLLASVSGFFVLFCGAPVSAIRAWAMSLVGFGADLVGRRNHALSAVAVVGLVMALTDPTLSGQLGFLLSLSSVVGLGLFSSYAQYVLRTLIPEVQWPLWLGARVRRTVSSCGDALCGMLSATLVCQLATIPLSTSAFGRISLVAPVANIVLGPLVTLLMGWGLACVMLSALPGAHLLAAAADILELPLVKALSTLGALPYASVSATALMLPLTGITLAAAAALLIWWPRVSRKAVVHIVLVLAVMLGIGVARWWLFAPARIVVLDVGQGDAILVQDGPHAVLVDTGPDDAVVDGLARNHVLALDAVIVTHLHDDHYGGIPSLVGTIPCQAVVVAQGVASAMEGELARTCRDLTGAPPLEIAYHDELHVGRFSLRMVWPHVEVDGDENAESIELLARYQRDGAHLTALLTGDAERDVTGACVRLGDVGDIDVLKVGHHGSEVSLDAQSAQTLLPELAIASAGKGNSYGHPHPECVTLLERVGATFLCTKDVGDVDVRPSACGVEVRCGGRP